MISTSNNSSLFPLRKGVILQSIQIQFQSVIIELQMLLKERMVRFLQESAEKLKLNCQSALHSIQTLNILDHYHHQHINRIVSKSTLRAKSLALAILSLSSKLHQTHYVHLRELAKMIHPKYKDLELAKLQQEDETTEEKVQNSPALNQLELELKQWEVRIMVWLKWKLAIPLLYDEVLHLAFIWDSHIAFLGDFPLKFEAMSPVRGNCYSDNHNFLAANICICLYNFNHLISSSPIEQLSVRVKRIALALFVVLIKKLMREKVKLNAYILSPRLSVIKMMEDFLATNFQLRLGDLSDQIKDVEENLQKYRLFREQSREKKEKREKEIKPGKKKHFIRTNKQLTDKENCPYYLHHKKIKSKKPLQLSEEPTEKYKSRSRSKKEKPLPANTCDVYKETRRSIDYKDPKVASQKESVLKPAHKKKSNSTKSILTKNILLKKEKIFELGENKREKKTIQANKSKVSKRSEKSQLNSKILPNPPGEEGLSSKSTYWLRSTTLVKTDKKSTNSSIRMKMR